MRLGKVDLAADLLKVAKPRVYELARVEGFFPTGVVVHLGRQVRFNIDALIAWVESGGSAKSKASEEKPCKS